VRRIGVSDTGPAVDAMEAASSRWLGAGVWMLVAAALAAAIIWLGPTAGLAVGAAVCVLVVLAMLAELLARRDLFAPAVFFPLCYLGYFAIGSTNSLSVGYVPPYVLGYVALGLAGYLAGVGLTSALARSNLLTWLPQPPALSRSHARALVRSHPSWRLDLAVAGSLAISLLATVFIVLAVGGTPLANLSRRWELSGYLFILAELGWVAAVWFNFDRWMRLGGIHPGGLFLLLAVGVMLALLAFRTPLLTMMLVAALGYHRLVRPLRPTHVAVLMGVLLLFAGLYGWWRLQHTQRYGGYLRYLEISRTKASPLEPLAPLITTIREGPVVLSLLSQNVPAKYGHTHGAVMFSTFETLLPGWQRGPREWIGIYARGLEHSTTPTILGFLYIDFGLTGIAVGMLVFGAGIAALYLWLQRRPSLLALWLWAYFQSALLLSIHTGFADFRHVALTVFALLLAWSSSAEPWAWLSSPITNHESRITTS
jgi:uncharacterized membrane protein